MQNFFIVFSVFVFNSFRVLILLVISFKQNVMELKFILYIIKHSAISATLFKVVLLVKKLIFKNLANIS